MLKETSKYFWKKHIKRRRNFKGKLVKEVDKTYINTDIKARIIFRSTKKSY